MTNTKCTTCGGPVTVHKGDGGSMYCENRFSEMKKIYSDKVHLLLSEISADRVLRTKFMIDLRAEFELKDKQLEVMREETRASLKAQLSDGNWNYDPYMHGMANGMILIAAILNRVSPEFLDAPKVWGKDTPNNNKPVRQEALTKCNELNKE